MAPPVTTVGRMQRTLVGLASLVLCGALMGAGSGLAVAPPAAAADGDLLLLPTPFQRLLIAVVGPAVPVDDDALAAPLHLADPAADAVVVRPGDPERPVLGFVAAVEATDGAVTLTTKNGIRVPIVVPAPAAGHVTVVEALGGRDGVVAHRIGDLAPSADELRVPVWSVPGPGEDAVALDGAWWRLAPDVVAPDTSMSPAAAQQLRKRLTRTPVSRLRRLVDASVGDVTGDGIPDLALSFRRPFQRTLLNATTPRRDWVDARGQSAHLGLFRPDDLSSIWVAGTLVRPIERLAACSGALAVAYSTLRQPGHRGHDRRGLAGVRVPAAPGAAGRRPPHLHRHRS